MRLLSWDDFNDCVDRISYNVADQQLSGVYGFPRGGLCLAVALSHALCIPLLEHPKQGSLVVDDIYETGFTLDIVRELPNMLAFVWISKVEPSWWNAIEVIDSSEWIVFPWESVNFAKTDEKAYRLSRY